MTTVRPTLGMFALLLPILSHAAGDAGSCSYVPLARLALEFKNGVRLPTVAGSINGVPARIVADISANRTSLMRAGAERLKLPLNISGKYTYGIGGASVTYVTQVDDFAVGNIHTGKMLMPVSGNSALNDRMPVADRADAVVGADYLLQNDMELAVADKTMRLFQARGCADTYLAYWDDKAMTIPFIGKNGRTSNKPMIEIELNGVKLKALFDTGANRTLVRRHAAERVGVTVDTPAVPKSGHIIGTGEKVVDSWSADFESFRIGAETIRNPRLRIVDNSPQGEGAADVLIGLDFLRAHRVLFAMSQDRLYLSYLGGPLFGASKKADEAAAPAP